MRRWTVGLAGVIWVLACGQVDSYGKNEMPSDDGSGSEGAESGESGGDADDSGSPCPERRVDERLDLVGLAALLETMDGVTHVESLVVDGTMAESLDFLSCLKVVDGELTIRNNQALTSLRGLERLQRAGSLRIVDNPVLRGFSGLSDRSEIDELSLVGNDSVSSLTGLPSGTVQRVEIRDSPRLTDVCALAGLANVQDLTLERLPALESIGCLLGARGWWPEPGSGEERGLTIRDNPELISLVGVPRSTTTLEVVTIERNDSLLDLYGLQFLERIQSLDIRDNLVLASLAHVDASRLGGLHCVEEVSVFGNPSLRTCEIDRFITSLGNDCDGPRVEQGDNMSDECG